MSHHPHIPQTRQLGFWSLWLLVVNGLVGAGIFGVPGKTIAILDDWSLWLFPICALIVLPICMTVAALASRFEQSGGPALYANAAFGATASFQAGWLYYLARLVSVAANANLLLLSVGYFWPAQLIDQTRILALAVLFTVLVLLNCRASRQSVQALGALSSIKFVLLLLFVALCWSADTQHAVTLEAPWPPSIDWMDGIMLLIYAFVGFESALVPAGEARHPTRHLPLAILSGLSAVTVLYVAVQWGCLQVAEVARDSSTPLLAVAETLGGQFAASLLMVALVSSIAANLFGAIFSTPRVSVALSEAGALPAWFSQRNSVLAPAFAVSFFGLCGFLLASVGSFYYLAAATVLVRALLYALCSLAHLKLRCPGVSGVSPISQGTILQSALWPYLALASCILLASQASLVSLYTSISLILVGQLLFYIAKGRRGKPSAN